MHVRLVTVHVAIVLGIITATLAPIKAYAAVWNGGNGNWNVNGNWNTPANVPDSAGETAVINAAGSYTVTLDNLSPSINSLSLNSANAELFFNPAAVPQVLSTSGAFTITSGLFNARGVTGTNINTSGWTNNGTFRVGGTSGVHNDVTVTDAAALVNNGTIQVWHNNGWQGRLNVTNGIANSSTGSIDITSIGPPSGVLRLDSSISNSGSVSVSASPATFGLANASYQNLTAGSTFTVSSALSVAGANSTFVQTNGTTTINVGGSISGLTSFTMNGGGLATNGSLSTATYTQNGGAHTGSASVNVGSSGIVNLTTGSSTAGYILGASASSGTPAQLNIGAGFSYGANATITGYGTITGPFVVPVGKSFTANSFNSGSTNNQTVTAPAFTNNGTMTIGGDGAGWHITFSVPSGSLTNAATGIINMIDATGSGSNRMLSAELNNLGTLNVNTNATTPSLGRVGAAHTNNGTINVNDAASITGASFTQTGGQIVLGGPLTISGVVAFPGGMIKGGGVGNSLNSAVNATAGGAGLTISPGTSTNILQINGAVTLDANDAIAIELGGTTQGAPVSGYDYLSVSGALNITGSTLSLSITGGFTPSALDVFTIVSATNIIGQFNNTPGNKIMVDVYQFDVTYLSNQIQLSNALSTVPEPSTLVLLSLGGLALVARRRRR